MNTANSKTQKRERRHKRIRSKIKGTAEMPRLSVFKSNKYMYAQLIDDDKGATIAYVSSEKMKGKTMLEKAKNVGFEIATRAMAKNIKKVAFDRGGFIYTGRVKALADGAREGGLNF
ncbi:MAG: rplR [Candidatus Paceibacter sp.]|jgi:large subunit ribosomal protein L18|nr:rplR [Candidatus Paceibacter sp.]